MRIRNKNIPIRVTEKELEIIDRKAAKAKLSRTDFLVTAALGKEITLMEDLKPILTELRRIGNNVNQLTKLANAGAVRVPDQRAPEHLSKYGYPRFHVDTLRLQRYAVIYERKSLD